jgi:predicted nucleotidyltransferase
MDLSAPYETVVPSLDGAVLEVLARAGKPVTGRQVQRLARRGSVPGVAAVLERLTETGIITAERAGTAILYTANRDHLAWPAVQALTSIREALLQRIAKSVRAWQPVPERVLLFGSAARGDASTASDIDLLVIHGLDRAPTDSDLDQLRADIRRWTGNHAQIITLTDQSWSSMATAADPLVESVERDGIDLLGKDTAA